VGPFTRATDGRLEFTFYAEDGEVLVEVMRQLAALLRAPEVDRRATDRLFPRAYLDPTEETAETEWQEQVHADLVDAKVTAFEDIAACVAAATSERSGRLQVRLDAEQEDHLLLGLNDARLTLAALAGEDAEPTPLTDWLGALVSELTDLKLSEFPEFPEGAEHDE
jgi:Domain of unknown function (DUF2017)